MDRVALLRKVRAVAELADTMLAAAAPAMRRWRVTWGHAKRAAVTLSRARRLVMVSRHFLAAVPLDDFRQLLGLHIYSACGAMVTWPFDVDCARRVCERHAVPKAVLHACKCGLLTRRAHAISTPFTNLLCPRCERTPDVFRTQASVAGNALRAQSN